MMYTMPKNLLSICVNFALATQRIGDLLRIAFSKMKNIRQQQPGAVIIGTTFRGGMPMYLIQTLLAVVIAIFLVIAGAIAVSCV